MKFINWLWEIPLSLASWIYFHVMKFLLGRLYTFALSRMTVEAQEWKSFSRETVARPFVLPIIATKGPRWNTHAVLLTAGPLEVEQTLSFDVAAAAASAGSWSIVIYANPGYETVISIESFNVAGDPQWRDVKLSPGLYSINARYYDLAAGAMSPAVRVDGVETVASSPVRPNTNDFYSDLRERDSRFYAALHYYVFPMLRFRRFLPESFVRREFLPVGDPGTIFRYGLIRSGESLEIESHPDLLANYDVYLTVYNRSSFPVASEAIHELRRMTEPVTANGFYLFRIRRKARIDAEYREEWLHVRAGAAPAVAGEARYRSASSTPR
jgi:hypothetical protein